MNTDRTGPCGSELNAELSPAFLHARDGGAAYPANLVRTWPAHNRARFTAPLYDQVALDAAVAAERERCLNEWNGLLLELRQMADDSADRGDVFAQRVVALLSRT